MKVLSLFTAVFLVLAGEISNVQSRPGGAPAEACGSFLTSAGPHNPTLTNGELSITKDGQEVTSYEVGSTYMITVGLPGATPFKGLIAGALAAGGGGGGLSPVNGDLKTLECSGFDNHVTHRANGAKTASSFVWTPSDNYGEVDISVLLVESYSISNGFSRKLSVSTGTTGGMPETPGDEGDNTEGDNTGGANPDANAQVEEEEEDEVVSEILTSLTKSKDASLYVVGAIVVAALVLNFVAVKRAQQVRRLTALLAANTSPAPSKKRFDPAPPTSNYPEEENAPPRPLRRPSRDMNNIVNPLLSRSPSHVVIDEATNTTILIPPEPVSDPPSLPMDAGEWIAEVDPASGDTYYYNSVTGESTWDKPAAMR